MSTRRKKLEMHDSREVVEPVNAFTTDDRLAAPTTERTLGVGCRDQTSSTTPDSVLPMEDGRLSGYLKHVFREERPAIGEVRPRARANRDSAKAALLALTLASTAGASCAFSPTSATGASPTGGHEVQIDEARATEYWAQFERRLPLWFDKIDVPVPGVPRRDEVLAEARFVEIDMGDADTCWYDPPDRLEIRIDMWESGCVPHEIGHLALRMAGHRCWAEWEHDAEIEKCRSRFK